MGNMTFTACILVITLKLQIIEQRYKSIMALNACVISVGGWFLWNILLGALYANNNEYNVKGGIFDRWGRSGLWWLVLIVSVVACGLLEIGIRAVKGVFWPTDVEVFQALEGDVGVRRRFEGASEMWMQGGRGSGDQEGSLELEREKAEEEAKREGEIEELLLSRPGTVEEGRMGMSGVGALERVETEEEIVMVADGGRQRTDLSEMLSHRFGLVRRESLR